jgi:hypothetical protein
MWDGESAMDHQPCQKHLIGVFRRISALVGENRRISARLNFKKETSGMSLGYGTQ